MADTFDSLRPFLADHLRGKGIDIRKRFRCLNPEHYDRDPSMGYDPKRHKVHCFACGADYDLFDLLMLEEGLTSAREALAHASQRYGRGDVPLTREQTDAHPATSKRSIGFQANEPISRKETVPMQEKDTAAYLESCFRQRQKTAYFTQRGLSAETVTRFHLGYDSEADCVVLPCDNGHFIRRSVGEKRYLNEKGRPSPLFRSDLLAGEDPVFLVEGAFDALSCEELGFRAVAMNGAGNREKIANILRSLPKHAPVALLPDCDKAGDSWATALQEEFPGLYRCIDLADYKDINEFLCADREGAANFLRAESLALAAHRPPAYEDTSAAGQMGGLMAYITKQAARPPLKTGFDSLDRALDGGLYDGLYVIGAVSSLGKTAFCMQMADQLAKSGRDVLIFSLEMTAFELMARSISRESFQLDTSARRVMAKTVRGVLDGRRYPGYTGQEKAHLELAMNSYTQYAGHLYFREGDHETGLEYIAKEIERHIAETGQKPVVLIDYLQIIAPVDVHFTDKQNLDRIVCALKKLSRTHELTIFAISSFNRENYNLEVSMNAFKESGGIDYSADVLMGLQARGAGSRSFNIDEEKRKDPRELELKILKNRSAAIVDPLPFRYYPAFSCFTEGGF